MQTEYDLGYRMATFWGKPPIIHAELRRITRKATNSEAVKNAREQKAIDRGELKALTIDGKKRVFERRARVGKYFSVKGGKIEPSKATIARNTRSKKEVEAKPQLVAETIVPVERKFKRVEKVGYVMRINGVAHSIETPKLPAFAH